MDTCPNCHKEIRPTARFCTSCGFRIPELTEPLTASSRSTQGADSGWGAGAIGPSDDAQASETDVGSTQQTPAQASPPAVSPPPAPPSQLEVEQFGESKVPVARTESGTTAPVLATEETISDVSENRINIALFHIERLRQLVPDITGWSEEQAEAVNRAIESIETALKGREDAESPYESLRETVKAAKRDPRDIDVMISLADRAVDIEDLLAAHDQYSYGLREALLAIKPAAVNYVAETKKPRQRRTRKRKTTTKTTGASKTTRSRSKTSSSASAKTTSEGADA